jgi:glycosyltransferase involved in cell wall biosynthesis
VIQKIPKVTVLLTTFNGVRFLEEQLTSLFGQQGVEIEIMANDDGSTDGTMEILEEWKVKGFNLSISQSMGLGPTRAFLKLLQACDDKQFVAFCDQDDVWAENKLTVQISFLDASTPMMSTCLRLYINENGIVIGKSKRLRNPPSFLNSMFENIAPGNTMLLNNAAVKVINELQNPPIFHYDSWIYLLISAFGKVVFVPSYFVKYRIHSNNYVGLRKRSIKKSASAIRDYLNQQQFLSQNKSEFLSQDQLEHLTAVSSFVTEKSLRKKLSMFSKVKIGRQSKLDELLVKFLLLFVR